MDPFEIAAVAAEAAPLPPEFSAAPDEFAPPSKEMADLAEGITPPIEEFTHRPDEPAKKKASLLKRIKKLMFGATAAVLSVVIATGSASSSGPLIPDIPVMPPAEKGVPIIELYSADAQISGSRATVSGRYNIKPNGAGIPIEARIFITDASGRQARADNYPEYWGSISPSGDYSVDISELIGSQTEEVQLKLTVEARYFSFDPETEETKEGTVSVSASIRGGNTGPQATAPRLVIDSAVYVPSDGTDSEHVDYTYHIERNGTTGDLNVIAYVSDAAGYTVDHSLTPNVYSKSSGTASGTAYYDGSLYEGWNLVATLLEEDITVTYPVDMSAYDPSANAPQTYPLGDGTIILTVYNNTFDGRMANDPDFPYMGILLHETIKESEWQDITIPEANDPNADFDPFGYVLHIGSPFDFGYSGESVYTTVAEGPLGVTRGCGSAYKIEGNVLTREMVELVSPNADGIRYVNVHVVWMSVASYEEKKLPLELDFGDWTGTFEADQPFASEGYFYMAAFDKELEDNAPEGKTFAGWYDDQGNKVDFISYYDFFPLLEGATSNEDRDWSNPVTIHLKALWK